MIPYRPNGPSMDPSGKHVLPILLQATDREISDRRKFVRLPNNMLILVAQASRRGLSMSETMRESDLLRVACLASGLTLLVVSSVGELYAMFADRPGFGMAAASLGILACWPLYVAIGRRRGPVSDHG